MNISATTVTPDELVWSFAGVRSLYDDGADKPEDVTRDYVLALDDDHGEAPLLTIYGGKITTHRRLAEAALAKIGIFFDRCRRGPPARRCPAAIFRSTASMRWWRRRALAGRSSMSSHARRLVRAYGRRIERILKDAQSMDDLGPRFTGDLTGAEVRYLVENEWAQTRGRRAVAAQQARPQSYARAAQRTQPVHCVVAVCALTALMVYETLRGRTKL